jgi:hypothetical protein
MFDAAWNPAYVDPCLDSRAVTFENPTGARGAGSESHGGRKGAPSRRIGAGALSSRGCGQDRVRSLLRCIELGEVAGALDQGHLAAPKESGKTTCEGWI